VGIPFLLLSGVLAVACIGWFKRRLWGWYLTVAVIATQIIGDVTSVVMGDAVKGLIGFAIAGTFLVYLLRPHVRNAFASGHSPTTR